MGESASDGPSGATQAATAVLALKLDGVSKTYPGVRALRDVDLAVRPGEVHALVGGNGAGKSTLIKVAGGVVRPDSGTVHVHGREMHTFSPIEALRLGIRVIHQERHIAPELTIAENVLLGQLPSRGGRVHWGEGFRRARKALDRVGVELDPRRSVRGLGVQQLQQIEIARALSAQARVVIMDEPTAALNRTSVAALFENVRALREDGVAVVYISHHLEEIFEIADRVTVMRDGQRVTTHECAGLTHESITGLMFGKVSDRRRIAARASTARSDVVLRARNLRLGSALCGVDVEVHAGEIVCVTGGAGSGRRELARCLAGSDRPDAGDLEIDGTVHASLSPRRAVAAGLAFVPQDRKRDGLLLNLGVSENIAVSKEALSRSPLISHRGRAHAAHDFRDRLRINTPSIETPVGTLSGGNQQKVLLARCLLVGARVLVLDEPTAGIDVNAKLEIYELLSELAGQGVATLVFSSDYDEVQLLADRALVLRGGRVVADLARDDITEERLLAVESAA